MLKRIKRLVTEMTKLDLVLVVLLLAAVPAVYIYGCLHKPVKVVQANKAGTKEYQLYKDGEEYTLYAVKFDGGGVWDTLATVTWRCDHKPYSDGVMIKDDLTDGVRSEFPALAKAVDSANSK